ncbi:DUF4030 domain-containing protein [Priestia aryabhattai]|uniref:DUF4030 domain-containing protein n=1 Tax=Priestia aryabhattai TaxID=412384 RepID=A0AAX6NDL1_PRIAR|nr:DUF4030 domain-containing protein [Priestia aryabhattai]MDU9693991.1 DUF4030 domain-containing protein [Priestia aryabhattai]
MKQDTPSVLKNEIDKIEVPQDKLDTAIQEAINKGKKQKIKTPKNRLAIYVSAAAILFFSIFIGSAFVFAPIGSMASKIPYLGAVFQSSDLTDVIMNDLDKKGYKINSVSATYLPAKEVEINIMGNDQYFNAVKGDVKEEVQQILQAKGYDSYSIKLTKYKELKNPGLTEQQQKDKKVIAEAVSKEMAQKKYNFKTIEVDPFGKEVFVDLKGDISYYDDHKDLANTAVKEALKKVDHSEYKVHITNSTPIIIKKQNDVGGDITSKIGEGLLSKKEYKVTEVGYVEDPLTFNIKTSVSASDSSSKALAQSIEKEVNQLIELKNVKEKLNGKLYKVVIYSKNGEKLN